MNLAEFAEAFDQTAAATLQNWTITPAPTAGEWYSAWCHGRSAVPSTTVTWAGTNGWSTSNGAVYGDEVIDSISTGGGRWTMHLMIQAGTGGAGTIDPTFSAAVGDTAIQIARSTGDPFTGVRVQYDGCNGLDVSTGSLLSISAITAGNEVHAAVMTAVNETKTWAAGHTALGDVVSGSNLVHASHAQADTDDPSPSISWSTSTRFSGGVVELETDSAGPIEDAVSDGLELGDTATARFKATPVDGVVLGDSPSDRIIYAVRVVSDGVELGDSPTSQINQYFIRAPLVGVGVANMTNLQYAVFAEPLPENWTAPALQGNDGTTDGDGIFELEVTGFFFADDIVYLYITNSDGTVAEMDHHGGPIAVVE
jgi:hypothetical protein